MDFALSALFYTDKFIANNNLNGNETDFWYNLPKSIYTYIFGSIINWLLKNLSSAEDQLNEIQEGNNPI